MSKYVTGSIFPGVLFFLVGSIMYFCNAFMPGILTMLGGVYMIITSIIVNYLHINRGDKNGKKQ